VEGVVEGVGLAAPLIVTTAFRMVLEEVVTLEEAAALEVMVIAVEGMVEEEAEAVGGKSAVSQRNPDPN
jgi:hypothetical protein